MKEFTSEMLEALTAANEAVRGTDDYGKFYMQTDCKSENGKWFFVGHNIPYTIGTIKTFKGNMYIMTLKERYHVTEAVKELLDIGEDIRHEPIKPIWVEEAP